MKLTAQKEKNQSDKDFSGLDFTNKSFYEVDFHESVFNGSHFKNVKFSNCNLKHTEFTEAKFTNCLFVNSDLNYSDFVYTKVSGANFEQCSFSHVEWRDNNFEKIEFKECSFYNSTISLCTFKNTDFDSISSQSFCGASKRYNIFSNSSYNLMEEKIEFLRNNYGIRLKESEVKFDLNNDYKNDFLLKLSVLNYSNRLNTEIFIDLLVKSIKGLLNANQKNRIQKIKYSSLICKSFIEANNISIFGQQFLVNAFNDLSIEIKDSTVFMEVVNLIMYIKTNLHKSISKISLELEAIEGTYSNKTIFKFFLDNTYTRQQINNYLNAMESFMELPNASIKIVDYHKGSTIVEVVIEVGLKLSTALVFISFSLSKVSKSLTHIVEIKKNAKKIFGKEKSEKGKKEREIALVPLSIMSNEGNKYYFQINNVVNHYGKEVIKIDGSGKVDILIDNSSTKKG